MSDRNECSCTAPCWKQVKDILEEEANRLALFLDSGRTDSVFKNGVIPHRVEISLRREIERLRHLASWVENVYKDEIAGENSED